jgi:hypothetical protein
MTEPIWKPIEIVYAGRTIAGRYARDGLMLRVQAASCEKSARLSHFPPEVLAGILLRELAEAEGCNVVVVSDRLGPRVWARKSPGHRLAGAAPLRIAGLSRRSAWQCVFCCSHTDGLRLIQTRHAALYVLAFGRKEANNGQHDASDHHHRRGDSSRWRLVRPGTLVLGRSTGSCYLGSHD